MRRVIIESPLAGNVKFNIEYARLCMRDSLKRGEAPFVSHLLYPQVLDDLKPEEREQGMDAGFAWNEVADRTAVYMDLGISSGMRAGIATAERVERPVDYRYLFTVSDEQIADRIIEVMNSALKLSPKAIHELIEHRVGCSKALADHPTVQVGVAHPEIGGVQGDAYHVGLLGLLNGLAGTQTYKGQPDYGRVTAVFQVVCPECGNPEALKQSKAVEGDPCPECGKPLILGPLECFKRVE